MEKNHRQFEDKYKKYDYNKPSKKKKSGADLYEQFIDHDYKHHPKAKEPNPKAKTYRWTPEDQALEDILWAS